MTGKSLVRELKTYVPFIFALFIDLQSICLDSDRNSYVASSFEEPGRKIVW